MKAGSSPVDFISKKISYCCDCYYMHHSDFPLLNTDFTLYIFAGTSAWTHFPRLILLKSQNLCLLISIHFTVMLF